MRSSWLALLLVSGCPSPAQPVPAAAPAISETPAKAVVVPVVAPTPTPAVMPPSVPAGGHALRVQVIRGPEPADGSGAWTRVALRVVDVAGTEQASAITGRIDAPCNDAALEAGDLARWVCWWAGSGWNLRLLRDGEGAALRAQIVGEGLKKPGKWQDLLWVAVPEGPALVLHRDAELEAADDPPTEPRAGAGGLPAAGLRVKFERDRILGSQVVVRVEEGDQLHALARGPWLAGARTPVADPGAEALAAWRTGEGEARLITSAARVALQVRRTGAAGPEPWQDVVRVSLPHGRAVKLVAK